MERHIDILEKQEQTLRFAHFTHKDALDLGLFMVDRARRLDTCVSVAVRSADGAILYNAITGEGCDVTSSDKFYHWGALLTKIVLRDAGKQN